MRKYAVMIDWIAGVKPGYGLSTHHINAVTLLDAMNEAEKLMNEDVYLVKILEKSSRVNTAHGNKTADYTEVLVNRGHGWHAATPEHCESSWLWNFTDYGCGYTQWSLSKQLA